MYARIQDRSNVMVNLEKIILKFPLSNNIKHNILQYDTCEKIFIFYCLYCYIYVTLYLYYDLCCHIYIMFILLKRIYLEETRKSSH